MAPRADRDAVLGEMRERVRREMIDLVSAYDLDQPDRRTLVGWWVVHVGDMLARHTRHLVDATADARFRERRRQEHAAMPDFRWWER